MTALLASQLGGFSLAENRQNRLGYSSSRSCSQRATKVGLCIDIYEYESFEVLVITNSTPAWILLTSIADITPVHSPSSRVRSRTSCCELAGPRVCARQFQTSATPPRTWCLPPVCYASCRSAGHGNRSRILGAASDGHVVLLVSSSSGGRNFGWKRRTHPRFQV
ncbi:hypothetical protein BJV74DRAFT_826473 [Russula compacta]|nr:hypothetical protein BJV74DRAFT_826473 [Russula compacta]